CRDADDAGVNHNHWLSQRRRPRPAEVRHAPAVERAAQLRARCHRPPPRPHRGVDGLRPRGGSGGRARLRGMTVSQPEYSDVLIIGAGISGIGAAYRIHERNPQLSYTVLERRARVGGTWDLFQYPGIRSDSDIY